MHRSRSAPAPQDPTPSDAPARGADPGTRPAGTVARNRPDRIRLVPIGRVDAGVLAAIGAGLEERFHVPVETAPPTPLWREWYDDGRGQFRGDAILDALIHRSRRDTWSLGVVDGDLYVPGLNFIFGQATVGGCCAIIGLGRLRADVPAGAAGTELFLRRALTEAVHEIGHIVGLEHCPDPRCVMHFSETIEETDHKGPDFCDRCNTLRHHSKRIG